MSSEMALSEAVAYVQGVGVVELDHAATLIAEQLAARGYSVQPISAPVLHNCEPATLRRVRLGSGVTRRALAREAGLSPATVSRAERSGSRPHQATLLAIGDALLRLGAVTTNKRMPSKPM